MYEEIVLSDSDDSVVVDEIVLDSDDDEPPQRLPPAGKAGATMAIINARPLDPRTIGFPFKPQNALARRNNSMNPSDPRTARNRVPITYVRIPPKPADLPQIPNIRVNLRARQALQETQKKNTRGGKKMKRSRHDDPGSSRGSFRPSTAASIEVDWRNTEKPTLSVAPAESQVSDARLKSYHFDATGPKDPNGADRKKMPWMRFRCTFGGCRKVVNGDYNFVVHLWAHMVTVKEDPEERVVKGKESAAIAEIQVDCNTDFDKLCRCPECLTRFRYPYQMQVHYTRAHSKSPLAVLNWTCTICEKCIGVEAEALRSHLLRHSQVDAPYNCRVCKYRTTLRNQMFAHYIEAHGNTGTLMCPFCMFTHAVPTDKLNSALFFVTSFVQHMKAHCNNKQFKCYRCACSFVNSASLKYHDELDHRQIPDEWTIDRNKPKTVDLRPQFVESREACKECSVMPSALMKKNEKCPTCTENAFWKTIKDREASLVGKANYDEDTVGGPIPAPPGFRFRCRCGLSTFDKRKFILHFQRTQHFFKIVEVKNEPNLAPIASGLDRKTISREEENKQELMSATTFKKEEPIEHCKDTTMKNAFRMTFATSPASEATKALEKTDKERLYEAMMFERNVARFDEIDFTAILDGVVFPEDDDEKDEKLPKKRSKIIRKNDWDEEDSDESEREEENNGEEYEEQESEGVDEDDQRDTDADEELDNTPHSLESAQTNNEREKEVAPMVDASLFETPPNSVTPESTEHMDFQ